MGESIDEKTIEALSSEAETGYDPATLRPRTVIIPWSVYDAMQNEIHDLRGLFSKIAAEQELMRKRRYPDSFADTDLSRAGGLQSFFYKVEHWIADHRKKDYR